MSELSGYLGYQNVLLPRISECYVVWDTILLGFLFIQHMDVLLPGIRAYCCERYQDTLLSGIYGYYILCVKWNSRRFIVWDNILFYC
jgi:hypothetical protein